MEPADVIAIHGVLAVYGHVVDAAAWDRLDEVFADDSVFHVVNIDATMHGPAGIGERFATIRHPIGHHITNVVIEEGTDPSAAMVRSKFITVRADGTAGTGRYDDEFVRTPAGWRIRNRVAELVTG